MTELSLDRLVFDPSDPDNYNNVGSFVRDGYGYQITSTDYSTSSEPVEGGVHHALDTSISGFDASLVNEEGYLNVNIPNNVVVNIDLSTLDTDYGTVGADTLRTAAQIGNSSGAADFGAGATSAQTLRVVSNLNDGYGNAITSSDGYLNVLVKQGTDPWVISFDPSLVGPDGYLTVDLNVDMDYGTVGDHTIRTASQIGNTTGAADFDAGATSAQTLRVVSNLNDGYGNAITSTDGYLNVHASVSVEPSDAEFAEGSTHNNTDVGIHIMGVDPDGYYTSFNFDGDGALEVNVAGSVSIADDDPDAGNPLKVGSRAVAGPLAALSNANDRADLISDLYRRIYINDSCNIGLNSTPISVNASAVSLITSPLAGRRRMIVQNRYSTKPIFVGPSGVLVGTGLEIKAGQSMSLEIGPNVLLYAISTAGGTGDVRVFELA